MPAAAVIPAPIAYIKVVAVKKLVVGFLYEDNVGRAHMWMYTGLRFLTSSLENVAMSLIGWCGIQELLL